jgi:exopolysaccharide production protein ExoQ
MNTVSTGASASGYPYPQGQALSALGPDRSGSLLRFLPYTDRLTMFAWVVSTTIPMSMFQPIRYLCIAYFVACIVLYLRQTLPTFARGWPALIIPVLCVISAIWAPSSSEAIRKGLFMFLTVAVAVYAASRLSAREILLVYVAGEMVGAVMSVMSPNIAAGAWTGVFGQKNHLAVHMFILFTGSFALALDRGTSRWIRGGMLGAIALSGALIILSKSATTILLTGGATLAFLGHAFLWQPAARVPHMRTLLAIGLVLLAALASLLLFGLFQFDAMDTVLKAFGKDSTLTGRTFLWAIAERTMAENPWTGVGANGFWRPELGAANEITTFFHYEHFVKFSFHNSYYENGVQLGYPGYYATMFMGAWALFQTARTWLRNQTLLNAAFLILAVMVIIRSNAEPDLGIEFGGTLVLLLIGGLRKEDLRRRPWPAAPPLPPTAQQPDPAMQPARQ